MNKYICKLYWEVCGEIEVEANSSEEAAKKAEAGNLPEGYEYVPDSEYCDPESDVQLLDKPVVYES